LSLESEEPRDQFDVAGFGKINQAEFPLPDYATDETEGFNVDRYLDAGNNFNNNYYF
jgi:hypothetical protein